MRFLGAGSSAASSACGVSLICTSLIRLEDFYCKHVVWRWFLIDELIDFSFFSVADKTSPAAENKQLISSWFLYSGRPERDLLCVRGLCGLKIRTCVMSGRHASQWQADRWWGAGGRPAGIFWDPDLPRLSTLLLFCPYTHWNCLEEFTDSFFKHLSLCGSALCLFIPGFI